MTKSNTHTKKGKKTPPYNLWQSQGCKHDDLVAYLSTYLPAGAYSTCELAAPDQRLSRG